MNQELEKYILSHIDQQDEVLYELERYTNLNVLRPRMLSGHMQGSLLKMICRMINPVSVLEIGTFTGYSAICLTKGMCPGGHMHTIEINDEVEGLILEYFHKAGVYNQITLHIGNALQIVPTIDDTFDLVFLDGDKREYSKYLEMVLPKVKTGGFILADNILWDGKVAKPGMPDDDYTKGIMDFNNMVKEDERLEKTIIPMRDGLLLIRKTRD